MGQVLGLILMLVLSLACCFNLVADTAC